ncbi:DEAD/DEAH box helicase [Xanthobacter dioxanivorans]|uniref:DEAD/DEAH box helicase n=1 Tax=Xanthobacter dioxanivorans TaxID=2528964 RepID=A0A974SHW7_9HYPH|nr:helicase-related protein [Xanthobacter dioxanivorans]QRG05797.1 DEAD/DEAH box helicase [Xanthobacter dioxanivorans]
MPDKRFDAAAALAPLKAFQRRTVDYVFDRLYGDQDPVRQFLVADEVGLGKTMVARGVIARTIEKLWDTTDRIDILYICSNQAIAAQNLNRLNVLNRRELALPTRMTLIPLQVRGDQGLDANKVNFISLTPGTTFDLRSTTGVTRERALLLRMLEDRVLRPRGLHNLLQVTAGVDGWNGAVRDLTLDGVDQRIIDRFRRDVESDTVLFEELEAVCDLFPRRRETYPYELGQRRNALIGRLRGKLSHACIDALKPDLIIMDEFQRFRDLLHGDTPAAELARELFDYSDGNGHAARTLLLSATPYRMLTLSGDEPDDGEHYRDFLETLSFLYGRTNGPQIAATLEGEMRQFRGFLHALPEARPAAIEARRGVERHLRKVMARTERVASTVNRDSMVAEPPMSIIVQPADLRQAASVSDVARALEAPEITEYWKSAPYLLNFMRDYALKRLLKDNLERPAARLREALVRARPAMLDHARLDAYEPLDPANGRMRGVMDDVFGDGLDQNLWIPPSLPYYGPARQDPPLTKALIFSSWSMVPDAIAAILSYEAERRMGVGEAGQRYFGHVRPRPIQFRQDQGRLAAMRAMHLIYPSPTLAQLADPLAIFADHPETLSVEGMRKAVADRLRGSVDALTQRTGDAADGRDWEWAAPAVIDAMAGTKSVPWLTSPFGLATLGHEEGFKEHVAELHSATVNRNFGPVGDTILDLLVDVALGSPAVCALRALRRIAPDLDWDDPRLLKAANQVAWGFRTLFNQHDAVALLRKDDDRYWHRVLTYGVEHNLQAVLDEYAHYLVDAEGLGARPSADRIAGVSKAMVDALSIRPSQIDVEDPTVDGDTLVINKFQMRGRFAMRLADYKDEEGGAARLGSVRDAFNSPFRPFALATTSVGQEGLDFHPYCYRVYHWNLPGNPVDLEQREGRVHRFKGHAIRLNLAHRQIDVVRGRGSMPEDPWKTMFDAARVETDIDTDLIPYWIYEGPVRVERRVPMLPFSREVRRLEWLKRSLTVYRLAFGQPRQEDLLEYLHSLLGTDTAAEDLAELQIRLEP